MRGMARGSSKPPSSARPIIIAAVKPMEETPPRVLRYCIALYGIVYDLVIDPKAVQVTPFSVSLADCSLMRFNAGGIMPEPFKIIKVPLLAVEHMDDDVTKIQEYPFPFLQSFRTGCLDAF